MKNMNQEFVIFVLLVVLPTSVASGQTRKSLVIGVDGLGYGTHGLEFADTPFIDHLIEGTWQPGYQGAYSSTAFAGGVPGTITQQATVSGPGWSTMLTGVWIDRHGVSGNGSSFNNGNFTDNPPYIGAVKSADPELVTASFVNWGPIDSVLMHAVDTDSDPNNNLDIRGDYNSDQQVAQATAFSISGTLDPDVVFVAFDEVDAAGHAFGGSSIEYRQQIEITDFYIGQILNAISGRPDFEDEDWQIIITSDHGHRPTGGHGGQSSLERTIPFIVCSKTLGQGNLPAGVSHADIAPTVMEHFGFEIPSHYWGQSRSGGFVYVPPRTVVAHDDFEGLNLLPFTVATAGDGSDWTDVIGQSPQQWVRDNSEMSGTTTELAYYGWTAVDVDSWIAEQGVQIGRSRFASPPHNTILLADPDAWDDYTSDAIQPGFNAYVYRDFDLTGVNYSTLRIELEYEFVAFDQQRGTIAVSFDGGAVWQTLLEFDSSQLPNDTILSGHVLFDEGAEFIASSANMRIRFSCVQAANDWWFAIDNVRVTVDVLLGDANRDGAINLLDVLPFVDRVTSGDFQPESDMNQDGSVNLLDVDPFVDTLTGN